MGDNGFSSTAVTFDKLDKRFPHTAPISGRLSDRYSVRLMAMVSAIGATSGILLTGFAPSLPVAILTYGVIFGKLHLVCFILKQHDLR